MSTDIDDDTDPETIEEAQQKAESLAARAETFDGVATTSPSRCAPKRPKWRASMSLAKLKPRYCNVERPAPLC